MTKIPKTKYDKILQKAYNAMVVEVQMLLDERVRMDRRLELLKRAIDALKIVIEGGSNASK